MIINRDATLAFSTTEELRVLYHHNLAAIVDYKLKAAEINRWISKKSDQNTKILELLTLRGEALYAKLAISEIA